MIIRSLEEVLKTHPTFKPGWEVKSYGCMENPEFGRLTHVVVCKNDGTPIYDQYMIEEQKGTIIIPYDDKEGIIRVGLVTQERPIPGGEYFELPRGFGKEKETALETAYRELLEETGLRVLSEGIRYLGRININTSFYKTDISIIAIEFKNLDEMRDPKGDKFAEKLIKVAPYNYIQIRDLDAQEKLEDGITKAGLFRFILYKPNFLLSQKTIKKLSN